MENIIKESSAKLSIESDQPISKTAKDLGIDNKSLHNWMKKYYPDHQSMVANQSELIQMREELKRLRKDNSRLRQERDILKKATACVPQSTKWYLVIFSKVRMPQTQLFIQQGQSL